MGVNSLPKTVTQQHHGCDLNLGPSAPESSTLTTQVPSHPWQVTKWQTLIKCLFYTAFLTTVLYWKNWGSFYRTAAMPYYYPLSNSHITVIVTTSWKTNKCPMQQKGKWPVIVLYDRADRLYCPNVRVWLLWVHEMKWRMLARISIGCREINPDLPHKNF